MAIAIQFLLSILARCYALTKAWAGYYQGPRQVTRDEGSRLTQPHPSLVEKILAYPRRHHVSYHILVFPRRSPPSQGGTTHLTTSSPPKEIIAFQKRHGTSNHVHSWKTHSWLSTSLAKAQNTHCQVRLFLVQPRPNRSSIQLVLKQNSLKTRMQLATREHLTTFCNY